jgi:O-antigen ligase
VGKPSFRETQIVWLAAAALGIVLLSSLRAMEGKWFIALLSALLFWAVALLTGRIERFLFGFLFFMIPLNVDMQFFQEITAWKGVTLPTGTPQLSLSVMDLSLLALYPLWVGRLLAGQRRTVLWPAGATLAVGLILWAGLSILNSHNLQLSFSLWVSYLKAFLLFFYVANNVRTREDFLLVARCLIAGMAVESLIVFAQQVSGGNLGLEALGERKIEKELEILSGLRFRAGGTLGHPNSLGGYLAAALPVALAFHLAPSPQMTGSPWRMFALGAGFLALILSLSRSAWLAAGLACAGLVVWLVFSQRVKFRWQPLFGLLFLGAVAAAVFAPLVIARWEEDDKGSTYSRLPQAQMAMGIIREHPLLGVGLNNYNVSSHLYETYVVDPKTRGRVYEYGGRIHNVFLQMAAETGLVGLAWFFAFMVSVFRHGWRRIRRCPDGQVRYLLVGLFWGLVARLLHDSTHTGEVSLIPQLWVYSGLLAAAGWLLHSVRLR